MPVTPETVAAKAEALGLAVVEGTIGLQDAYAGAQGYEADGDRRRHLKTVEAVVQQGAGA